MAAIECTNCGADADDMDGMCPACGESIYDEATAAGEGYPVDAFPPDTSSSGRAAYLDELASRSQAAPPWTRNLSGPGRDLISRLAQADEQLARCEVDMDEAASDMRAASVVLEQLAGRALDPEMRAEYIAALGTRDRWLACEQALEAARQAQGRLLAQYEAVMPTEPGRSANQVYRERAPQLVDPDHG